MSPILVKWLAGIAVVVALLGGGFFAYKSAYNSGFSSAETKAQLKMSEYKESQRKALEKLEAENRKTEEELVTRILEAQAEKDNEINEINIAHQRLVDSLRDRARRIDRDAQAREDSTAATANCPRAACTGAELSREDAEFLAGEAAFADTLRKALEFCRATWPKSSGP